MIKYNNSNINDWYYVDDNIIKVYRNNAICYYKITTSGGTSGQTPCYAVVDDISQYQDTEFVDVFNKADEKWYKLNNNSTYEQYGVYGNGRNITYYQGKLTIDSGYEYIYSGSSWVSVGEVSGSSRVPAGYVELTYAQTTKQTSSSSNAFTVPIDLQASNNYIFEFTPLNWEDSYYGHVLGGNDGSTNFPRWGIFKLDNGWGDMTKRFICAFWNYNLETRSSSPGGNYRVYTGVKSKFTMNLHNYTVGSGADIKVENDGYEPYTHTSTTILKSGYSVQTGVYNIDVFSTTNGISSYIASLQFHNLKVETSGGTAVYDYIPTKRESDNKVGLYDLVNNEFFVPSAFTLTAGDEEYHTTYPLYYDEIQDPPNNLSFSSMTEAEAYECPWVGMTVSIDGDRYVFSGDSTSGYEWVYQSSRLPIGYTEVEYLESPKKTEYPYIDTGFKPNQNTRVIADYQYTQTNTHPRCFGCGPYNGTAYILNAENGITSSGEWRWKFGYRSGWLLTGVHTDFNRHTAEINNGKLYLDNTQIGSTEVTTFQLTDNIGLFGFIQNGTLGGTSSGEYMTGKFYSFKIYDNGTLVRDFVPCVRDSDNKAGMYDIVGDSFYSSPNNYNFTAGDPV